MSALLKTGLVASIFALGAMALPAQANEWERERDANGLYKEPVCDFAFRVKSALTNFSKQASTGLKASNDKWEMEIYSNTETKSWTLVGKSKAPDASTNKLCRLAGGPGTNPYSSEKWYAIDFSAKSPKVATTETGIKPHVN